MENFENIYLIIGAVDSDPEMTTLAEMVEGAAILGDDLDPDLIAAIAALEVGQSLTDLGHMEDVHRVENPNTVWGYTCTRDGHRTWEVRQKSGADKEAAICDLFDKWYNLMQSQFIYNVPGEILIENDEELGGTLCAGGEEGYYHCACEMPSYVGSPEKLTATGRADFPLADYPTTAAGWIEKDITRWRWDTTTFEVTSWVPAKD